MSYIFDVAGETVWSPSLRLGRLFIDMVGAFSRLVGHESGLSAMAEDYYEIEVDSFTSFIKEVLTDPAASHPVYSAMVRGLVLTSMVIINRAGGALPEDLVSNDMKISAQSMAGSMPDL